MKRFHILYVLLCVSTLLYGQTSVLIGKTYTAAGKPLTGVKLLLLPDSAIAYTDAQGKFSFAQLREGNYTLNVDHTKYRTTAQPVSISGALTTVNVQLFPLEEVIEEVVIFDNLISRRMREESLNVEVVKPEFLQRHLGGSLMKTLERLPGIKTIGIGSGNAKPLIRGLGFNRVVVLDKGVKHEGQQWGADHGLELDQFASGEVELVKGAASFMFGSDAIGGAIAVKPPRLPASNAFSGSVNLIGKTNNNLLGTSINLATRNDKYFVDGRITHQAYGDYRVPADQLFVYDFVVPLHQNYLRNTAGKETGIHLNTGYVANNFKTAFFISNIFQKSGFFANAHGLEPRRIDFGLHDASDRDILQPKQSVNHFKLINNTQLKINEHYLETEIGFQRNFRQEFNPYTNHGYMPAIFPTSLGISRDLEREFDKYVYSFALRDNFRKGAHQITVGVNSEFQNNAINGWTFLVPAFRQFNAGLFLYDKFQLNERTFLHSAIRYDYAQINMRGYTDWFPSTVNGNSTYLQRANDLRKTFNSLVYSAGINYNPGKFEIKANLGKSFRIPIAKELGANGVNYHYFSFERGNAALSPEVAYQADVSLGYQQKDWSVKLSPFYNYFPNYIYLNPTAAYDYFYGAGNQVFRYEQSKVMRFGAELTVKYKFLKTVTTEILAEYLYSEQLSGDKKGYTLPFSPPPSVLFNLTWSPLKDGHLRGSYISTDLRITGRQHNIVPPEKKTAGFHTINMQAGTTIQFLNQPVEVSFQVQNLLNTRYMVHTSFYRLIELPEAGRNIVLSLKVPFNFKNSNN